MWQGSYGPVRYSGHQDSHLVGLVINETKQAGFPTIRRGGELKGHLLFVI